MEETSSIVRCPLCNKDMTRLAKVLGVNDRWLLSHHLSYHDGETLRKLWTAASRVNVLWFKDPSEIPAGCSFLSKALKELREVMQLSRRQWYEIQKALEKKPAESCPAGGVTSEKLIGEETPPRKRKRGRK